MGQSASLGQFANKVDQLERLFSDSDLRSMARKVATESKQDGYPAVRADIGDFSMSGWPRRSPMELGRLGWEDDALPAGQVYLRPFGRTVGPWRVLERGREAAGAGTYRSRGVRKSKKRGAYTALTVRKRTVGAMAGKGTWSDAEQIIARNVPTRVHKQVVIALQRVVG